VGVYPGQIWNSSNFTLTKLATGDGVWVDNWDNWGEAFDAETRPSADLQPLGFSLYPSRPNPFNPTTAISFQLAANSLVSLKVYDTAGRLVATLVDGWREAGTHEVTFDAAGLPSGVYVYRLQAGDFSASQKLALLK